MDLLELPAPGAVLHSAGVLSVSAQHRCGKTRLPSMWAWPPVPAPERKPFPRIPVYSTAAALALVAVLAAVGVTVAPPDGELPVPAAVSVDMRYPLPSTCGGGR